MKISEAAHDPSQYLYVTDSILHDIARRKDAVRSHHQTLVPTHATYTHTQTHTQALAPSRDIIRRIQTRQLYKFVDEAIIPPQRWDSFPKQVHREPCECACVYV